MSPVAAPLRSGAPARAPHAAPQREPESRRPAPRLRVVEAPASTRSRLPFAATCAGLLGLTLVALLLVNIALSRGAYQVHELEQRRALLAEQQQALSERLAAEAAPGRLAERAAGLGMVPNESPALLRLEDGAVLGSPEPATAPPPPEPEAVVADEAAADDEAAAADEAAADASDDATAPPPPSQEP